MNFQKLHQRLPGAAALLCLPLLAACNDPFGPLEWSATPDTVTLYSATRVELIRQPAAFDFALAAAPVYIESANATNAWDVVLVDVGGQLALAPASYFAGQSSRAAIAVRPNSTLADVTRAPSDTSSYLRTPVPLQLGTVYIVRSRVDVCEGGYSTGTRYAKLRPVTINQQAGTFTFEMVRNPYCSNKSFIPPKSNG